MYSKVVKALFLGSLPAITFVALVFASEMVLGKRNLPWVDWSILLGSASLMIFNPILNSFESKLHKGTVFAVGFVMWAVLLFFLTFAVIWIRSGDSL